MSTIATVKRVPAVPVVPPPDSFEVTLRFPNARAISAFRKALQAVDGVPEAAAAHDQIKAQTGNTGEFYSFLKILTRAVVAKKDNYPTA